MMFKPSPTFVDLIINHPTIRANVERGMHKLASAAVVNDRKNEVLAEEQGVALFVYVGNGVYKGHIFCLPGLRGREAIAFGRQAIQRLFSRPGARELVVSVPLELPAARFYCRRVGLKPDGRDLFQEYFSVEAREWVA